MFLRTLGGCAIVASILLAGAALTFDNACAADLPIPVVKPAARPDAPPTPEARKRLLEEFRQFLRERGQPH
jgi:hypothetical protein